jgi:hypothetical protein
VLPENIRDMIVPRARRRVAYAAKHLDARATAA